MTAPLEAYRGRCWRFLAPRWAHAPLSGEGAARRGGRFNRPGQPALYVSEDPMTAYEEYQQGLPGRPGTLCAFDLDMIGVVDLTDPTTLETRDIDPAVLSAPWKTCRERGVEAPGWVFRDSLLAAGFAGIRVLSFATSGRRGVNLVLWRWNDDPERRVTAFDPQGDLPVDARR